MYLSSPFYLGDAPVLNVAGWARRRPTAIAPCRRHPTSVSSRSFLSVAWSMPTRWSFVLPRVSCRSNGPDFPRVRSSDASALPIHLADPLLTTYILLWGSIREPFLMKMLGDDEYLWSYTKGFAELPSPAQVRCDAAL